jgi:undecaprenyl-phosphate 4-deoxy-4-formamido-L-arabinose transferase
MRENTSRFEVIFVEDDGRDSSWSVIQRLAARHSYVTGIKLMRNFGQHNALLCGIRNARHETVVTIDDDLQNPPEEIPALLRKMEEGFDVVYGTPRAQRHGILRDVASTVTKIALQSVMGADTARRVSAFRAFRTSLRDAFADYRGPYVSIDVLLTWGTRKFASVTVRHDARTAGTSNYTFQALVRHAMNMLTGFSTIPLRVASIVGLVFTAFGGVLLVFILVRYLLYGAVVPGFAFLASTVTILSGAQLFTLGIMGEYLARMHFRLMDKPSYAVLEYATTRDSSTGDGPEEPEKEAFRLP